MRRDPENHELTYLLRHATLDGRRVLDVGCGDGALTSRFAPRASYVAAVDPSRPKLQEAAAQVERQGVEGLYLAAARGQALPFPTGHFDLAFFTSSF